MEERSKRLLNDMARKGKNKKNKKRERAMKRKGRKFNQKEFVEILCPGCCACIWDTHSPRPLLCYNELYRHDSDAFCKGPYVNLIKVSSAMESTGLSMRQCSIEQFRNIFCGSGNVCHNGDAKKGMTCDNINECYALFREQMGLTRSGRVPENEVIDPDEIEEIQEPKYLSYRYTKKQKRRKSRFVAEAYPSSFMSSSKDFQDFVARILNGNNDNKQNKDKESAGENKGGSDNGAEGGESKVSGGSG